MSSSDLIRWGGLAALIGGVLYALTGIMSLFAPQEEVFDSFTDYFIEVLFVLALVGTLMAIAGLHILQRERYGRLGAAGSLTAFVGHALLLVAAAATILAGREALDIVFLLGSLAALIGLVPDYIGGVDLVDDVRVCGSSRVRHHSGNTRLKREL